MDTASLPGGDLLHAACALLAFLLPLLVAWACVARARRRAAPKEPPRGVR